MSERGRVFRGREAQTAALSPGRLSAPIWERGSVELRFYQPRGEDTQSPHDKDELYVVHSGRGVFLCDGERTSIEPGDALFAAAGAEHRFDDFSDDFAVWVLFYGPPGGE